MFSRISKAAAEFISHELFNRLITNRIRADFPEWPGAITWQAQTWDSGIVQGWACPSTNRVGTAFIAHGFTEHSMSGWVLEVATQVRNRHGLACIAFDSRHHGRSHDRSPTFGTGEMWDLQAAIDWASNNGYPRPFVVFGLSLGAMGAGRTAIADARVAGAFLQSPPAWPWDAIGVATMAGVILAGPIINAAYDGWDILSDGDIRSQSDYPKHMPLICYAMGSRDNYGIEKTKLAYHHWYGGQRGDLERWPGETQDDLKWFVTFEDGDHCFSSQSHPRLLELRDAFIQRLLA